jgi:hypothetical protein
LPNALAPRVSTFLFGRTVALGFRSQSQLL